MFKELQLKKQQEAERKKNLKAKFVQAGREVIREYHQGYIDAYPEDPSSFIRQGVLYHQENRHNQAIERFLEAIDKGASTPVLWKTLANSYLCKYYDTGDEAFLCQAKESYEVEFSLRGLPAC